MPKIRRAPRAAARAPEPEPFPGRLDLPLIKVRDLSHGENPHQRAALYRDPGDPVGVAGAEQLGGGELSYTNILDLDAAWGAARDFTAGPFAVVVHHAIPCGAARGRDLAEAFSLALAADPPASLGGVVALSRAVTAPCAARVAEGRFEAVIAPGYAPRALEMLRATAGLRVLRAAPGGGWTGDGRRVAGGWLVQEADAPQIRDVRRLPVVTRRTPGAAEYRALEFAWRMVRHVRSSAIVFATAGQLVGVGAGQTSRVDACRSAVARARLPLAGTAVGSDAFFSFRDGIDAVAAAGASAVIQPGGSRHDREAIAAADEHGLAMVFTGYRHFKH